MRSQRVGCELVRGTFVDYLEFEARVFAETSNLNLDLVQPTAIKSNIAKVSRLVPPRSAQLLAECYKLVKERLPLLLKLLFDKANDSFFELANKADSSQRQQLYFDTMRELKLKRQRIEGDFFKRLQAGYEACTTVSQAELRAVQVSEQFMELSLVEENEVEESLAITNFTESLKTRGKSELFPLDQRIGHLVSDAGLVNHANPFGPESVGIALKAAAQQLDVHICWRRVKTEPPRRLNNEPGLEAELVRAGCG
ncbi:MAG: DUF1631 family protein [Gammaproteobacteria bacterium]|nr:DUF1631 family protein [Gammaproteobacteria bacterium]